MIVALKVVGFCITVAIAAYTIRVCRQDEREKHESME